VNRDTPLHADEQAVRRLEAFLDQNQLLQRPTPLATRKLLQLRERIRKQKKRVRLQQLMFFRMPLFRPDRFLSATLPYIRFVYTRGFAIAITLIAISGLILVSRQWASFTHSFSYLFSLEGMILFGIAIMITKAVHELGHAYTAKYLGLKVPTIGLALLIFWPVLYTDTTDSWRLRSSRQRLTIGIAGVAAELILAALATLLWSFLPDGALRSTVFFVAAVSWVLTLLVNLNPFLRWDGYYVLSDLWGVENLQQRSFALARWWMRRILWGLEDPPPERFSDRQRWLLILYAFATWIYRFLLFASIGVLMYQYTFKIVGIVLLGMLLTAFILRPVSGELRIWWRRRADIGTVRRSMILLLFFGGLIVVFVVPWSRTIDAPALMRPHKHTSLFAPVPARIAAVQAEDKQKVMAGDVLFRLESPALEHEQQQIGLRIEMLRSQIARQSAHDLLLERQQVLEQQLSAALAQYRGNAKQLERLTIRAPYGGTVVDVAAYLEPGRWIQDNLQLALVVDTRAFEVVAYVNEADLARIRPGAQGKFYADDTEYPSVATRVIEIDQANIRVLDEPYNASIYGGRVGVQRGSGDDLSTLESLYRLRLKPNGEMLIQPARVLRGQVRLQAESRSLIDRLWRLIGAVLIRESGF
jgi:putative peptide zinc metalloprotease protein